MKKTLLSALALFVVSALHAQFYAPETEFHDHCQRTFPVEAARVLAWEQNAAGGAIAEVTYELETKEGETTWQIRWLDEKKKPLREKTVHYAPAQLLAGPEYFREVFRQLEGDDWQPKAGGPGGVDAAFWKGAMLAGVSRLEALVAANGEIAQKPQVETAAEAAQLAGILVHGAIPQFGSAMTLDSLYISRGAAWLCLAEQLAGATDDAAWAPILFLSSREHLARDTWKKAGAPAGVDRGVGGRFWEMMLRPPSAKDCFIFAAQRENHQFAMPAMIYPAQFEPNWMELLVEVSDAVLGKENVPHFYEYGPNVSIRARVGGGQWGARMPGVAMGAWLDTLAVFQPPPRDFLGYQAILKPAASAADAAGSDEAAAIVAVAPLLNLGLDENRGALIPVATATARDLLGYGWEMAGLQFGYTHSYLMGVGDGSGAAGIAGPVLENIKGLEAFFRGAKINPRTPLEDLRRLQFVGSSLVEDAFVAKLPDGWQDPPERYLSRHWLVRGGIAGIEAMMQNKAKPEELRVMIERLRQEGGPLAICNLVNRHNNYKYPVLIDLLGLRHELLADLPWNYRERVRVVAEELKSQPFERARALEGIGWESLQFPNHYEIFSGYVVGGAEEAAKRFYEQIRPFTVDGAGYSNSTGPARYALAWIEGDEATERRVIEDCDKLSYPDLKMQIMDGILHGDYAEAREALDAALERYGHGGDNVMKAYLPLFPALIDVNHADHAQAIEKFPQNNEWLFLRWALARQAFLPKEDVARLFQNKANKQQEIFGAAAEGDKNRFRTLYAETALDPMERMVMTHEFLKQEGARPPRAWPDLKPAGSRPLGDLIREELRRQAGGGSAEHPTPNIQH